ncbi:biotin--[acetyl-CoA-carboxylase] ligase [Algisphaera agarilytica]|nr:biotin--[acetyl-CoA-carboxylase] ligase [Algisphaera agarilytica]
MEPATSMLTFHFEEIGSTSDEAKRLIVEHADQIVLVWADTQTQSRGSHGRSWKSPQGGAWFSLAVPMPRPEAATPVVVGEALIETLSSYCDGLTLKHPNDILRHGKKLVGILCEQTLSAGRSPEEQPPTTVIVGVGINANFAASELGDDLRTPPTSLRDILGHDVDLNELIQASAKTILARLRP